MHSVIQHQLTNWIILWLHVAEFWKPSRKVRHWRVVLFLWHHRRREFWSARRSTRFCFVSAVRQTNRWVSATGGAALFRNVFDQQDTQLEQRGFTHTVLWNRLDLTSHNALQRKLGRIVGWREWEKVSGSWPGRVMGWISMTTQPALRSGLWRAESQRLCEQIFRQPNSQNYSPGGETVYWLKQKISTC